MKKFIIFLFLLLPVLTGAYIAPVIDLENSFGTTALDVSKDGSVIYAAVTDGTIRKLEANSGRQVETAYRFPKTIADIAVTNNKLLVLSDKLYLFDPQNSQPQAFDTNIRSMTKITADRNGGFAAGIAGSRIILFSPETGRISLSFNVPSELYAIAFNPSLKQIYAGGKDGNVYGYSAITGGNIFNININCGIIRTITAANNHIVAGGSNGLALITIDSKKVIPLPRHEDDIRSTAITPNGRFAVSGGDDKMPVIWDLESLRADNNPVEPALPVKSVAIDPYFRYIVAAGSADGDSGGIVTLQYTANKSQIRKTYFYRDASLTVDKAGHVDGTGLLGKYIHYTRKDEKFSFIDVAQVVHKPEKLVYSMPLPKILSAKTQQKVQSFSDTTPPIITLNERGFIEVNENDLLVISGTITDESGVEWAKFDNKPLSLDTGGTFKIEIAKGKERSLIISASDVFGNTSERIVSIYPDKQNMTKNKKTAILVGINNYKHLAALKTPEYDARVLGQILNDQFGYEVRLLLGKNATREAVLAEINNLRKTSSRDDKIIIYYAGHGYHDRKSGNLYWQPYDSLTDDDTRWLLTEQLTSLAASIDAENLLIISDSCYSGITGKQLKSSGNRILISSGGDEPVLDTTPGSNHSIFTGALIKALKNLKQEQDSIQLFKEIIRFIPENTVQKPQHIILSGKKADF